ncbi:ABC transporter permease [Bacillus sp. FJAT-50079]|uniref:ABC transporter permease n=1 Tax=Bacillus sp. FJAT-50079 TaxID=2833577 RepID=UPI001BC90183|nr:ABC transporter permease [Bacillus sp. FJAT-50079]MBS4208078.1 ABC transporter permease [Bacillus sp. FJAT-50079]
MIKKNLTIKSQETALLLVLLALILIFSILSPQFFMVNNMFNITKQVATLGICAVGFTFVLITGGIDLSVGYQVSLINIIAAYLMAQLDVNWMLAMVVVMAIGTFIGFVNGMIITKTGVAPIIVTLSMMIILNGISYLISKGLPIFGFPKEFTFLGQGSIFSVIPVPLLFLVVIMFIGAFILNKTYYGRYFYAIGSNEEAAKLSGVNTGKVRILVYSLCGLFTSIGAILLLSRLNSAQSATGAGFEFSVLTACVLGGVSASGGKGTIFGAMIGVLIVGVLDNGLLLLNVSAYVQLVIKGIILLTAVIYDTMSRQKSEKIKRTKAINAA